MNDETIIQETDWLIPKNMETPQGPDFGPLTYRVFKRRESVVKNVTVSDYVAELAFALQDLEIHMSILMRKSKKYRKNGRN